MAYSSTSVSIHYVSSCQVVAIILCIVYSTTVIHISLCSVRIDRVSWSSTDVLSAYLGGLVLAQRRRRCANTNPTQVQRPVCAHVLVISVKRPSACQLIISLNTMPAHFPLPRHQNKHKHTSYTVHV